MNTSHPPVVIIGAGLAGLACAITLHKSSVPVVLLEKSDQVGGRVRTFRDQGYLLDHGFQVLLTTYPELKNFLDLDQLDMKYFNSGALIYTPDKLRLLANPLIHPSHLINESFSDIVSFKDKALVLKLITKLLMFSDDNSTEMRTIDFLRNFGFSDHFIEIFWRPFLAGVYLDLDLEVDAGYFMFLMRNFSKGRVGVPAQGMQEIPLQMLGQLPKSQVEVNAQIEFFSANEVRMRDGRVLPAKAVVVAHSEERDSTDSMTKPAFRGVVNYYFSTTTDLNWDAWLLLVPPQFGLQINNVSVMSNVSADYAPPGEQLISVSLVGHSDPGQEVVKAELQKIAGVPVPLKFIRKFHIKKALPKSYSGTHTEMKDGVYFCGDHLSSPSLNGALKSGRLTAQKIMENMGHRI